MTIINKGISGLRKAVRRNAKDTVIQDVKYQKRTRNKRSWYVRREQARLERTPATDTFENRKPDEKKFVDKQLLLGDFLVHKNRVLSEAYKNDLEEISMEIPGVSFIRELNTTSAKELKSILDKIAKRAEQFIERGYKGVIRDGVRATIFMPDADKNYVKIVETMKKRKYKIAKNFAEGPDGKIILDEKGKPIMVDDIDIRFGENACQSGYEDVQIRFQKGDVLYELIILPGPFYMTTKNREHEIYDQFKRYKVLGFEKDAGAKQIIYAIKEKFAGLTRLLYAQALQKDKLGANIELETPKFSNEDIKDLNSLFKSLKNLYTGKYESTPPSKRTHNNFKETRTYHNLNDIETNLRGIMKIYKPAEAK